MIYTFYSYKGGVGRTMALANLAELFYRAGKRVLMIDWDLEAPGLEQFFFSPEELPEVRKRRGVIDLVLEYKEQMKTKLELSDPDHLPFEHPRRVAKSLYPRENRAENGLSSSSGQIWLITAGQRTDKTPGMYARSVLNFDWLDFYDNWAGETYIDWFRRQCKTFADVILIDSRTGVTEMGGVCTYHLADVVVMFCAANNQNIQGTLDMLYNFSPADPDRSGSSQSALLRQRGWRPLKTLVVPSRIDRDNPGLLEEFKRRLAPLSGKSEIMDDVLIPYISHYSFQERVAVTAQEARSDDLVDAYTRLFYALGQKGEELREAWERRIEELQQALDKRDKQNAELKITRTLTTDLKEKSRIDTQMREVSAERQQIEEELRQLQREIQYYRMKKDKV